MINLVIEQIKVGFDNFSYIIYCQKTKKAAIVDPGFESKKLIKYILSKNLILEFIFASHYHYDHTKCINKIKNKFSYAMIAASDLDGRKLRLKIDKFVKDDEIIKLGNIQLKILLTPGHTPGGICIIVNSTGLLTGDTLFIGDCGRTDLPGGNIKDMYKSLNEKIKNLPDNLIIYPGHNYGDKPFDTLKNQKVTNKTLLAKNFEEFLKIP